MRQRFGPPFPQRFTPTETYQIVVTQRSQNISSRCVAVRISDQGRVVRLSWLVLGALWLPNSRGCYSGVRCVTVVPGSGMPRDSRLPVSLQLGRDVTGSNQQQQREQEEQEG